MGRPRKDLNDEQVEQVEKYAELGLTQEEIGYLLGMSERTFARRTEDDERVATAYARGRAQWKQRLTARHRDIALGKLKGVSYSDQRKAIEFRLKSEYGWHEKMALEHSGPGGGKIPHEVKVRFVDADGDDD